MSNHCSSLLPRLCASPKIAAGVIFCSAAMLCAGAQGAQPAEANKFSVFDAGTVLQLLLSLAVIIGLIFAMAWYARKIQQFQLGKSGRSLRVLASTAVGVKERVVLLQVGDEQMLIGVAPGQVSLLGKLDTPIEVHSDAGQAGGFVGQLRKAMAGDQQQ